MGVMNKTYKVSVASWGVIQGATKVGDEVVQYTRQARILELQPAEEHDASGTIKLMVTGPDQQVANLFTKGDLIEVSFKKKKGK